MNVVIGIIAGGLWLVVFGLFAAMAFALDTQRRLEVVWQRYQAYKRAKLEAQRPERTT